MAFLKDDKVEELRKLGRLKPQPIEAPTEEDEPEVNYDQQQAESLKDLAASEKKKLQILQKMAASLGDNSFVGVLEQIATVLATLKPEPGEPPEEIPSKWTHKVIRDDVGRMVRIESTAVK
jgi:hypothetical protein